MSTYNKNFISSIHFLDKREILSQVLDVQNEDPSFLDVMEGMRRSVPTSSAIFHNYVNEPVYEKLTLTGTAAGDNLTHPKVRKGDVIVDVANNTMWFVKNNASLEGSNIVKLGGSATAIADWTKTNRTNGKNFVTVIPHTGTETVEAIKTAAKAFADEYLVYVANGVVDADGGDARRRFRRQLGLLRPTGRCHRRRPG
jgi:hypothetical protein